MVVILAHLRTYAVFDVYLSLKCCPYDVKPKAYCKVPCKDVGSSGTRNRPRLLGNGEVTVPPAGFTPQGS